MLETFSYFKNQKNCLAPCRIYQEWREIDDQK